ncbi:uncharacterized protein LOC113228067 isoform X2 [Hyposmocoma kahamanoa]|uniref:uncharacterized protein LOC113228067 isoform X2 n=1 Tax=Hyposmocoma kahamanoa TaxID=1477025 RepID=UPI000E6D5FFB|nr:uncharacterized protein LOC113228067 isoform X2 [Hyposmocoma kahamanoa]
MEKEHQPDSMATITMKPEYPPSEVYSTSEPPPAYRQRVSSAVQIAKIAALTVVASSFILGAFILASSWVAARASCHQLEQLDAMLDKELALESRAYGNDGLLADEPLPIANAHALHGVPPPAAQSSAASVQSNQPPAPAASQLKDDGLSHAESKIDEDKLQKIDDSKNEANNSADDSLESDSSAEDEDELDAVRPMLKLPIQFDLDDLAGAFLASNQKGRMNCMVERRRDDPTERRFPFNILGAFAHRNAHAERIAIICHGGDEPRPMNAFPEPQSQVFAFPLAGPMRLPLRPQPADRPQPAQEPRMSPFVPLGQHRAGPFPIPMPWDSSEEQMSAPREMRIHVQRVIAIPAPHNMPPPPEGMGPFAPPPPPPHSQDHNEPTVLHQFVPQSAPTQELEQPEIQKIQMDGTPVQMNLPWGLTPEDLHVIHRTAEDAAASQQREQIQQQMDNDMQEVKTIVNTLAAAAEAEAEAQAHAEAQAQAHEEQRRQEQMQSPTQDAPSPTSRAPRTVLVPQELHMPMLPIEERPHYMQPRSVRSVDALLHREKRVKRCSCDCA